MKLHSPLVFKIEKAGGWSIRAGFSKVLIAEGPGNSVQVGRDVYKMLGGAPVKRLGYLSSTTDIQRDVLGRLRSLR